MTALGIFLALVTLNNCLNNLKTFNEILSAYIKCNSVGLLLLHGNYVLKQKNKNFHKLPLL